MYPGFLLLYRNPQNFGLVALEDVDVRYSDTRFIEEEGVPPDTRVIGETWKYVNKNGSPDRRFSYNPRIPVVNYGTIRLMSRAGLNEEFMFSNAGAGAEFAQAFAALCGAYRVKDLVS